MGLLPSAEPPLCPPGQTQPLRQLILLAVCQGQEPYTTFRELLGASAAVEAKGHYTCSVNSLARAGGVRDSRDDVRSR